MLFTYKFVLLLFFLQCWTTFATPTNESIDLSFLPICKRHDPELNECLMNATIQVKDLVGKGIPELKLPPLEPLKIPTIKLEQTTEKLSYKAVLTDVVLSGLSNYEFTDINADLEENLTISVNINFEHVYMDAEYMLMGSFEMLPVEGSGHMMVNFTDNKLSVKFEGGLIKKHNKLYYMNHDTDVKIYVGDSSANFENLYSGNAEKTHISEHIINMHSQEILKELQPAAETVIAMLFDDIIAKFYKNISFDKLFPE